MSNERGFFMSKRKYTTELKLQIVEEYQQGELGLKLLSEKYCVSKGDIQKWSDAYREHGLNGLCKKYERYSGQFKVDVIEYMHNTCSSARQTAAHFNISSYTSVCNWERIYMEKGKEALLECVQGGKREMKNKPIGRPPKFEPKENEDLIAELQRLRMENEYLKKLNALVQEREKSKKPIK